MAFSITSTWLCQAIVIGTTSRCVNCFRSKVLFIFIIRCSVRGTFEMWANGIFIARCWASQFSVMQQASNSIFFACCTSANSDFHTQFWCWWWWQRYILSATDVTANGDSSAGGYDGIKPQFCIFGNCCHNASRCDHKRNGPKIKRKPMTSETIENYDCVRRNYCWTYIFEQRWWWWWWWWVVEKRKKKSFMMMLWTELNSRSHPLEVHFTEAYTRFRLLLLLLLSAWELAIHMPADYRPFRSVLAFEFQEFTRQWSMHTELSMHWTFIAHQQQQQQFIITSHSFWALAINI